MGNNSSKKSLKTSSLFCCLCTLKKSSRSNSSLSIDEKVLPTFDRLTSNEKFSPVKPLTEEESLSSATNRRSVSLHNVILTLPEASQSLQSKPPLPPGKSTKFSGTERRSFRGTKRTYHSQSIEHAKLSIEDLEKSLHGASSIDQWIDSLPILGTPSLNRNKSNIPIRTVSSATGHQKIKRSYTVGDDADQNSLNRSYQQETTLPEVQSTSLDLSKIFPRQFVQLAKDIRLTIYLNDFLSRLTEGKTKQSLTDHFSSMSIIYPLAGLDQILANDLIVFLHTPSEEFLPRLSSNSHSNYKLHEQIRSKCYFSPLTSAQIEINDEEYQRQSKEIDRTHVVITLENKSKDENLLKTTKKSLVDIDCSFLFISNDSFRTGSIRVEVEKLAKHWLTFLFYSSTDQCSYLSSNLIQHWFQTLILVNQTCAIGKRFLKGDGSHITCLLKPQNNIHHLTFAALRLPPSLDVIDCSEKENFHLIDAFSSTFLSDHRQSPTETIHIDYEQYSFALTLSRWPKFLLDHYHLQVNRRTSPRQWPSNYQMNILIKRPLLLVPIGTNHQWEIQFDAVEQGLFQLINRSNLCFYAMCQQIFSQNTSTRFIIKHCFLNYCEKHGLPFSKSTDNSKETLWNLLSKFSNELKSQLIEKFIPHYFNQEINLFDLLENVDQWFDHIDRCVRDRLYLSPTTTISDRPIIIEFLFHFLDQLYQTFHLKRSQFHLNENVLLDLHQQVCEKFSNDSNNNNSTCLQKIINELLNNGQLLEQIQWNLTDDFESNAELVHTCLNQVRKADSSLIFHYTWTIYIQYLHTYYNVLWNI